MSIHPILLRAVLTAVVAEITNEQREALCSGDDGVKIEAEERLVNGLLLAMARVDRCDSRTSALPLSPE